MQGDAVACGGKDLARADGDELAALIFAGHVVEHSRVVDEGIQLPAGRGMKGRVSSTQMPEWATQNPSTS